MQYPLVVVMIATGEIYQLINFASFSRWFFIALATLGMLIHRHRFPLHPRPFKVAMSAIIMLNYSHTFIIHYPKLNDLIYLLDVTQVPLAIAVIFTVVCFFIVGLSLYSDPWNTGQSCALTLTGIPVYFLTVHRFRLPRKWRQIFGESHENITNQKFIWSTSCGGLTILGSCFLYLKKDISHL